MRFFKYIPLIILTLVLTISSNAYTSGFYGEFKIPTNAVIDGDTFIIRVTDKNVPQRYYADLSGVDCPELDQPYGKLAKDRTVELLAGKRVKSPFDALIAWSRTIIDPVLVEPVIENGVSKSWIAKILVEEGSCWYDSHALSSDSRVGKALKEAQKEAQAARRGLWQQSNPIPPAEYRATQLKKQFPRMSDFKDIRFYASLKHHDFSWFECVGHKQHILRNLNDRVSLVMFQTRVEVEAAGFKLSKFCSELDHNSAPLDFNKLVIDTFR